MEDEDMFLMISREMLRMAEISAQAGQAMKEMAEFVEEMNVRVCALEAFHERKQ